MRPTVPDPAGLIPLRGLSKRHVVRLLTVVVLAPRLLRQADQQPLWNDPRDTAGRLSEAVREDAIRAFLGFVIAYEAFRRVAQSVNVRLRRRSTMLYLRLE
ncbi:hypothetical protein [Nonomuraea bangladeshensis]|uniref:hypothetical protein n=1 Tax=Nonomuraea bangladeshensis TaxID=404385 RepID=UPI0031D2AA6D